MTIHKEGYLIILVAFLILGTINVLANNIWPGNKIIHQAGYIITSLAFILIVQFFRSPDRKIEPNENIITAPADGKIVVIEEVEEPEYFKGKRIQISIFMSPINVHVNWYPMSGTVKYYKYHPGDYLVAWHPKSSTKNERSTLVVESPDGSEILIRQIAGAVARRIVTYGREGDQFQQGNQLGFIKFGSRVDVFLPLGTKILVQLDQKVKGCLTPLASFK
jgi:phosphatidylserine decarboxylase